jgi:hypothetical protein
MPQITVGQPGDSSDSEEEHDDAALPMTEVENPKKLDYSSVHPVAVRSNTDQTGNYTMEILKDADAAGTALDMMLTPMVKVSNEYIAISLNNQSPALAIG